MRHPELAMLRTRCGCTREIEIDPDNWRLEVVVCLSVMPPLGVSGKVTDANIPKRRFRYMGDELNGLIVYEEQP